VSATHHTIVAALLEHGDDTTSHMSSGSLWMTISMMAFAVFLLAFAWTLLRPRRQSPPTPADIATERYARGEIDADDFERILTDVDSRRA